MEEKTIIGKGRFSVAVDGDRAGRFAFDGVEILRGLSAPVRDADWGSFATVVEHAESGEGFYRCRFSEPSGLFRGVFRLTIEDERHCAAEIELSFARAAEINRAGFCLLHPISGVSGTSLTVRHSDGGSEETVFPAQISPGQPAFDIVALTHAVGPVTFDIAMQGEIFEMEDQRNWSDASYKTYCRPLGLPHPFAVAAGDVVRQRVDIAIIDIRSGVGAAPAKSRQDARLPQVELAFESGLASVESLALFADLPVLARIDAQTSGDALPALAARPAVALELVLRDPADIEILAGRIAQAGLRPTRVVALPAPYLKSHQPEGPWPAGPTPEELVAPLRRAFPGIPVGGGSLTNFTEFNRRPPAREVDFLTFGNTAIVHAADDLSVIQTLEALPDIFASAKALCPGKPLHLGLFSIGMRSNPYGADVRVNPEGNPIPMARRDRRQDTSFAAAYAVAVLVLAARAGVDSIALAMPDGDLGAARRPVGDVLKFAAGLAGQRVETEVADGAYRLSAGAVRLSANLSSGDFSFEELAA